MTRSILSETLTAEELARRARSRTGLRMEIQFTRVMLAEWKARGIAEQRLGRWRLTKSGRAMFGGWQDGYGHDHEEHAA